MRKTKRVTKSFSVTMPKNLLAALDAAAARGGRSRSGLISWLIRCDTAREKRL